MITQDFKEKIDKYIEFINNMKTTCELLIENENNIRKFFELQTNKLNEEDVEYCKSNIEKLEELKNDYSNIKDVDNNINITEHFKNFIISEFVNYNLENSLYMFSSQYLQNYEKLILAIKQNEQTYNFSIVSNFLNAISNVKTGYSNLTMKAYGFNILEKIKDIDNNIVMIGSNGSGKSTFSRFLKQILFKNITVIPSQQLLYYEIPLSMQLNSNHVQKVQDFQIKDKLGSNSDIKKDTQDDFTNLIFALIEERDFIKEKCYREKNYITSSIFDEVVKIWEEFNDGKTIMLDRYKLNVIPKVNEPYDINKLSDGEKAIFYYASHILFAKQHSYIVIDEPENHLHTALCDKLWNRLEQVRPDCKFIYLTHNLDFAISRNNKTILWNKSFVPPRQWNVEILKENDTIPQRLLLEIAGSKKTLLFCEGEDKNSLDFRLYNSIFPEYTIIPSKTRNDVINYVRTYNKDTYLKVFEAKGLVDKDNYLDEEKLKRENIYILKTTEVENILCDEELITIFLDKFCSKYTLDNFKNEFFIKLNNKKSLLVSNYVTDIINDFLHNTIICNRTDLSKIRKEYDALKSIDIDKIAKEKEQEIDDYIKNKDFTKAMKNNNLKKILTKELCNKIIVNDFENRALDLINKSEELKLLIRNKYFPEL